MDETDKPVKFFYSKRLPELESALMIEDRSCPKTVAFWDGINAYRVYRGEQNEKDLKDFLSTLL